MLNHFPYSVLSPGQTDSQVDASQRKFVKPELAYGLAKGGQTDSQVAKSRKFYAYHWLIRGVASIFRGVRTNICPSAEGASR